MYNLLPPAITAVLAVVVMVSTTVVEAHEMTLAQKQSIKQEHLQIIREVNAAKNKKTFEPKTEYTAKDQLSPLELKAVLEEAGFTGENLVEAWGTAMKESTGRPMAHNKNSNTGDNSYGLFQINMIGSLGPARLEKYNLKSNSDLFDPLTNAKIAYQMSNGGKDWSAWHGITDRTKQWMKEFPY